MNYLEFLARYNSIPQDIAIEVTPFGVGLHLSEGVDALVAANYNAVFVPAPLAGIVSAMLRGETGHRIENSGCGHICRVHGTSFVTDAFIHSLLRTEISADGPRYSLIAISPTSVARFDPKPYTYWIKP